MANSGKLKAQLLANLRASPGKSAILAFAFVVLAILIVQRMFGGAAPVLADRDAQLDAPGMTESVVGDKMAVATPRLPRPEIEPVIHRDPFSQAWLLVGTQGRFDEDGQPATKLLLQATLTNGSRESHSAMISGLVVHVGDSVAGYQVLLIADRRVELQNGVERIRLSMP